MDAKFNSVTRCHVIKKICFLQFRERLTSVFAKKVQSTKSANMERIKKDKSFCEFESVNKIYFYFRV